jgi:WD repeat-containing protein 23
MSSPERDSPRESEAIWHPAREWLEDDELDADFHPALEPSEDDEWEDDMPNEDEELNLGDADGNTDNNLNYNKRKSGG